MELAESCIGAFGSGGVGGMPFGSGSDLAIELAQQSSLNAVDVTFSEPPLAVDPGNIADALSPANWTLSAVSGGARLRLVQYVVRLSSLVVRVYVDGPLDPFATYRLTVSENVTAETGASLSSECGSADFATMGWPRDLVPVVATAPQLVDIANPQTTRDASSTGAPLGTFQITEQGDFGNDSGRQNLRKRVFRRLTTAEGGFFHLAAYGDAPEVGVLVRADTLARMASRATAGLRREPDILEAKVTATQAPGRPGFVQLAARVVDRYGQTETITAVLPPRG